jgi:hypothetical protein
LTSQPDGPEIQVGIHWRSGASDQVTVLRPQAARTARAAAVADLLLELGPTHTNEQLAEHLNQTGWLTASGHPFTEEAVRWMRWKHRIPSPSPLRADELGTSSLSGSTSATTSSTSGSDKASSKRAVPAAASSRSASTPRSRLPAASGSPTPHEPDISTNNLLPEVQYEGPVDEVSWKRQHNYLTLVADHRAGKIVWGCEGAGQRAADRFFAELDPEICADASAPELAKAQPHAPEPADPRTGAQSPKPHVGERAGRLEAISLDMGHGYAKSAREHAPQAVVCIDPYHVVQVANTALDEVRRAYWNELRSLADQQAAKRFKDARWSLLKKPENLTDKQAATLARLKAAGGEVWRAYTLKEAVRGIFQPGLTVEDVTVLIDRLLSRLARSRLEPFIRLGKTIRKHRDGILTAIRTGINNDWASHCTSC